MPFAAPSQPIDVPNARKESSTIVVTSIAPPSVTPVHGTPYSTSISPVTNNDNDSKAQISTPESPGTAPFAFNLLAFQVGGVPVAGAGDFVPSARENSPGLPPIASAPALQKVPATMAASTTTVTSNHVYVVASATAPNLKQPEDATDSNLATAHPPTEGLPSEKTGLALNVNENEETYTKKLGFWYGKG
ncbi:unnamed protein product [Gongylonema pulchrum]|uniref:Uncharacterized protein n=1 Tax=Gongylonema pulchrum TaxID=637853 RepID=A0A3P6PVH0_9BILA|nr:unnamed protein product [Gongylonema pulchrum]